MKRVTREFRSLVVTAMIFALGGCASIDITDRNEYKGAQISRPDRIVVFDFAATLEDLPPWSDSARRSNASNADATEEEVEVGRELGSQIAKSLVEQIDEMGLPAVRAIREPPPRVGDLVLVGHLSSVEEGSSFKRVVIGFGSGSPEVTTVVEGYLATETGFRKLGSAELTSDSGSAPGVVLPVVVTIATANPIGLLIMLPVKVGQEITGSAGVEGVGDDMADAIAEELEIKFREQGWIED